MPRRLKVAIERLACFTPEEALWCIFPALILLNLASTTFVSIPGLHRYDLILAICLLVQVATYTTEMESRDELKVVAVFHLLGITLELFKVHRWWLTAAIIAAFLHTRVSFRAPDARLRRPLPLAFFLFGLFIWFAESIATYFNAWQYPSRTDGWRMVQFQELSSWFLLVIVSFIAVAALKHVKEERVRKGSPADR